MRDAKGWLILRQASEGGLTRDDYANAPDWDDDCGENLEGTEHYVVRINHDELYCRLCGAIRECSAEPNDHADDVRYGNAR